MKKNLIPHNLFLSFPVFLAINVGLILLDWKVLNSLFVTFSNEDTDTIRSGTMVLAIAIDATVMLIAHILAERFRNAILSKICVVALILAFGTAVTAMGCMRIMNADTIFESADVSSSESTDYFAENEESAPAGSGTVAEADSGMKRLNFFTQILFTLSPIFTSVVAFCLSCLRSQYKLKLDIQKTERHIEALNAEAMTIQNANIINDFEAEDDGRRLIRLNECLAEINNDNQRLKREVREIYMSHWHVPEHIHYARSIAMTASPAYYPSRLTAPSENPSSAPVFPADRPDMDKTDSDEDVRKQPYVEDPYPADNRKEGDESDE